MCAKATPQTMRFHGACTTVWLWPLLIVGGASVEPTQTSLYLAAMTTSLGNGTEERTVSAVRSANQQIYDLNRQGYAPAQFFYAVQRLTGFSGHSEDKGMGLSLLTSSALAGYLPAQLAVGHRHMAGIDFHKSCEAALPYYQAAAETWEQNYVISKQQHFELHYLPFVDKTIPGEAEVQMVELMAIAGHPDAQSALGEAFYKGTGGFKRDLSEAKKYFLKSKHLSRSAVRLGLMYNHGLGVKQDETRAREFFSVAAKQKSKRGMGLLASMCMDGRGGDRDYKQAFDLAKASSDRGDPIGMLALGTILFKGLGVKTNHSGAKALFEKATHRGSLMARYNLGLMYAHGVGTPRSCSSAVAMFRMVAMQSDLIVELSPAVDLYLEDRHDAALRLNLLFVTMGYSVALHNTAYIMHTQNTTLPPPYSNVHKDIHLAKVIELYKTSADMGVVASKLGLGDLYYENKDFHNAWIFYNEAGLKNSSIALFNQGWMLQEGLGRIASFESARKFYEKAWFADDDAQVAATIALWWLRLKESSLLYLGVDITPDLLVSVKHLLHVFPALDVEAMAEFLESNSGQILFTVGWASVLLRFLHYLRRGRDEI
eukprot:m.184048 g.184048  ORF g.184048 m.184048 type:complete len:599 (-) comp32179_c0_seq3:62-1858(-)